MHKIRFCILFLLFTSLIYYKILRKRDRIHSFSSNFNVLLNRSKKEFFRKDLPSIREKSLLDSQSKKSDIAKLSSKVESKKGRLKSLKNISHLEIERLLTSSRVHLILVVDKEFKLSSYLYEYLKSISKVFKIFRIHIFNKENLSNREIFKEVYLRDKRSGKAMINRGSILIFRIKVEDSLIRLDASYVKNGKKTLLFMEDFFTFFSTTFINKIEILNDRILDALSENFRLSLVKDSIKSLKLSLDRS